MTGQKVAGMARKWTRKWTRIWPFESFLEHVQLQYGEYLGPVIALPMKPMKLWSTHFL